MELLKTTIVSFYFLALLQVGSGEHVCQPEWSIFGLTCYKLFSEGMEWSDAKALCQKHGGELVTIRSKSVQIFVAGLVPGNKNIWLGLNDINKEGSYHWSDNSNIQYSYWGRHQPNNYCNQDCIHFWERRHHRWADGQCDSHFLPFCQKPAEFKCDACPQG